MKCAKHTIPCDRWWEYPVLSPSQFRTVYKFDKDGSGIVKVLIGKQDGFFVMGYHWEIYGSSVGCGGGGCYPGRKWGEFKSRDEAEEYALQFVCQRFSSASKGRKKMGSRVRPIVKAIRLRLRELRYLQQLEFFEAMENYE